MSPWYNDPVLRTFGSREPRACPPLGPTVSARTLAMVLLPVEAGASADALTPERQLTSSASAPQRLPSVRHASPAPPHTIGAAAGAGAGASGHGTDTEAEDLPRTAEGCLELRSRLLVEAWRLKRVPRSRALLAASVNCERLR